MIKKMNLSQNFTDNPVNSILLNMTEFGSTESITADD